MVIEDIDHAIAQRIAHRANEIYGTDYHVKWAYIDSRSSQIYNGSDYIGSIRNNTVRFDRNLTKEEWITIDLSEFLDDGGQ